MSEKKVSFETRRQIRIPMESDTNTCEKLSIAEFDNQKEIIAIRNKASDNNSLAEIAIYDMELNLKASDSWNGEAMDLQVGDINNDGSNEIIVVGKDDNPLIRIYNRNLNLISQTSWESQANLYGVSKCLHISDIDNDGKLEIIVLSIVEGTKPNEGYVQIRIYDTELQLKKVTRWKYADGKITKWGHCLAISDIDNDGKNELIALINFDQNSTKKSDLRILNDRLAIKSSCLMPESMFATCLAIGDINRDGNPEIVIGGGAFVGRWQGATNQLIVMNGELKEVDKITWKAFRHSWLWGIQIADIDSDGNQEIITYGGTSLVGQNQEEANIIGEISIRNGKSLKSKDMFLWQIEPAIDTRPSRGAFIKSNDGNTQIAVITSKWSTRQNTNSLEIRLFDYKYEPLAIKKYTKFIEACNEKDIKSLAEYVKTDEVIFAPIALEALSLFDDDRALRLMGEYLGIPNQPIYYRAIELLRRFGKRSVEQLRKAGFSIQNDWLILSPYDNTDNKGFDTIYPPEIEIDFDAYYAGKDRIIRWSKVGENIWDDRRYDIYNDLAYTHFDGFERTGLEYNWNYRQTRSVAYLLTYIYSSEDLKAQIKTGSADGIKVWVNGEPKYNADVVRIPSIDQDIFNVDLIKGKNVIMLKIASNNKDTWGYWGFYFRVTDLEGKQIPHLEYKQPEIAYIHNEMICHKDFIQLANSGDEQLQYLAGIQLSSSGDRLGYEALSSLLTSHNRDIRANSALALTLEGDKRGIETLFEITPEKDPLFQCSAGNALERIGDARSERFSIDNVKDSDGNSFIEMSIDERDYGFYLSPKYKGDDTAHVNVRTNLTFHLGENISAKCASIMSFGIREPEYRAMGIGRIALKKACDLIAEMGHSCTIVSTGQRLVAHRLYCQCGFFDRRDQWRFQKFINKISDNDTDIFIRNYDNADYKRIMELREQYMLCSVGPNTWSPKTHYDADTIKVAEYDGKIIGYVDVFLYPFDSLVEINFIHVDESFTEKDACARSLLCGIQRYAISEGKKSIIFNHQSPFIKDILVSENYKLDSSFRRHEWVGMFRINNFAEYLSQISLLLSSRVNKSIHSGWKGNLSIKGNRLKANIVFDDNGIVEVNDDVSEKADIYIIADDKIITNIASSNGNIWELYRHNLLTTKPAFNERIRTFIETLFPIMPCRMGGWW